MSLEDDLLSKPWKLTELEMSLCTREVSNELSKQIIRSLNESITKVKKRNTDFPKGLKDHHEDTERLKGSIYESECRKAELEKELELFLVESSHDENGYSRFRTKEEDERIELMGRAISSYDRSIIVGKEAIGWSDMAVEKFTLGINNKNTAIKRFKDIKKKVIRYITHHDFTVGHCKEIISEYESEIARYNEDLRKEYEIRL